jgi:hypothetical protein
MPSRFVPGLALYALECRIIKHVVTKHIIELNGKKYDALTGRIIPQHTAVKSGTQRVAKSIDGFAPAKNHGPRKVVNTTNVKRTAAKSSTLMRSAVKKPSHIQNQTNIKHRQNSGVTNADITQPNTPKYKTPDHRVHRAANTSQSNFIKKFSDLAAPTHVKEALHTEAVAKAAHLALNSVSQPISEAAQIGQQAIDNAMSHIQPKRKKQPLHHRIARSLRISTRALSTSAAVAAFVMIGGFFAYQNAPNLSMRVAAMRSDVQGSLPAYKPAGFSMNGPIKYEPGRIVVDFKSNSDSRNFRITEENTKWDTASLRENFVGKMQTSYRTVQNKGKTVYLYEDSNATWIDGGIWYKVEGDSRLNSEQLNRLINSL